MGPIFVHCLWQSVATNQLVRIEKEIGNLFSQMRLAEMVLFSSDFLKRRLAEVCCLSACFVDNGKLSN